MNQINLDNLIRQLQAFQSCCIKMQNSQSIIIKKDIFITNHTQDIRKHYQFYPKFLGRGSYGIVYKAKMINTPHNQRAVKIIPKVMLKNPQNLINQIKILKKLDHPNIVRLYQTFQDKDHYYLVLDYCQGGQLFNKITSQGHFSEQNARNLFRQIIKILKYLHCQKIAHRDLKPQNFLMYQKNSFQMKIIDFGLSYQYQNDMKLQLQQNKKNKLLGTAYYIAPQVIQLNYNQSCDVWSAGVILYVLATATPPFDGENDKEVLKNILKLNYSLQTPQSKRLSPQLKDLIRKILVPQGMRLSVDQILEHPWMTKSEISQIPLHLDFKKFKQFCKFSKLKTIAVTYIASQLPQKDIHRLGQIFKQIDSNGDGYLTIQQLKLALQKQEQHPQLSQLIQIIQTIDTDHNGSINYNQFVACCLESNILQNQMYYQYVFKLFDRDNNGTISRKEFKQILQSSNFKNQLLATYIDQIMNDFDKNNDGEIDYREFLESLGFKKHKSPPRSAQSSPLNTPLRIYFDQNSPNIMQDCYETPLNSPYRSPIYSPYTSEIMIPTQIQQQILQSTIKSQFDISLQGSLQNKIKSPFR